MQISQFKMKIPNNFIKRSKGFTLLELTVVVFVLITLVSVLFMGAKAYKDGADRANCVVNIRNVQVAVRSYQNMNALAPGDDIDPARLINPDSGYLPDLPSCPSRGDYTLAQEIPKPGDLALICSVNKDGSIHAPSDHSGW